MSNKKRSYSEIDDQCTLQTPQNIKPCKPVQTPQNIKPCKPVQTPQNIKPCKPVQTPQNIKPRKPVQPPNKEPNKTSDKSLDTDLNKNMINLIIFHELMNPLTLPPRNIRQPIVEDFCKNPMCNHKTYEEDPDPVEISSLTIIKTINDLISILYIH